MTKFFLKEKQTKVDILIRTDNKITILQQNLV